MSISRSACLFLACLFTLGGCQVTPVDRTPILLSKGKLTAIALDEPYVSLVGLVDPNLGPSEVETAFGPMIGRYFLTDDFSVFRHLKHVRATAADDGSVTGEVLGTAAETEDGDTAAQMSGFEQLTYFLVNPDGVVTGIATGRLLSPQERCIRVDRATELVEKCESTALLDRDLDLFDRTVRTLDGQPLTSWVAQAPAQAPVQ
jgi:hypothetical protein